MKAANNQWNIQWNIQWSNRNIQRNMIEYPMTEISNEKSDADTQQNITEISNEI